MSSVVCLDCLPACLCSQIVISKMLVPLSGSGWAAREPSEQLCCLQQALVPCGLSPAHGRRSGQGGEGREGAAHSARGRRQQNSIFFSVPCLWHSEHQGCAFWREASAVLIFRHSAGCQREVVWRCSWKDLPCSFLSRFMFLSLQTRKAGLFLVFI